MRYSKKSLLMLLALSVSNVYATTYYVKPDGNDSANGRSHGTAWKTVKKVNSFAFNTSDDVYFLSGGSWNEQIVVDWNGTATNRAIVGSYYIKNGSVTIGKDPAKSKPILRGNYPKVNVAGALPVGPYTGLVQVTANYVTVQNLRVENSSGSGIILAKAFHHAVFEKNDVVGTAGSSILFSRKTYSNVMRNNTMSGCATAWKEGKWISKTWPICNGAVGSRDNIITKNYVTNSYGENIVAFDVGADNNVISDNTLVVVRAVGLYVDNGANNTVERNLVIGDSSKGSNNGAAFALNVEDYPNMKDATGNIFRNNLAANTAVCFWVGTEPAARDRGYKVGADFVGNTCVGMDSSVKFFPTVDQVDQIKVANNIFTNMVKNDCNFPTTPKVTFHNNSWQVRPADSDCSSSSDVIADPQLVKNAGWQITSTVNVPKPADFLPAVNSPVVGKGATISTLKKDFYGNPRSASPSIGAIDANESNGGGVVLEIPKGISLTISNK